MRQKGLQAKHLTDEGVLDIIRFQRSQPSLFSFGLTSAVTPQHIYDHLSKFVHVPFKVVLAKLRSMERRGLIEGCFCGCGSPMWELDENGNCVY